MFYMCIQNIYLYVFFWLLCICGGKVAIAVHRLCGLSDDDDGHCIFMYSQNSNDISMVNKIKIVNDYI